jgi:spore germination protein YaaH
MKYRIQIITLILLGLSLVPAAASAATASLSSGDSGANVTALQNGLIKLGYLAAGYNTGYFGSLTETALKKFQCAKDILCSGTLEDGYGVYGPHTQAALQVALAPAQPSSVSQSSGAMTAAATGAFETSGWLPDWRAASSTADVLPHLSQMTSVMPFGFEVSADGTLIDKLGVDKEPWVSFIAAAHAAKVRVVPTVFWGSGPEEQALLSDTTKRIALEDAVAKLARDNGFDGIDIDFEAKQSQTINYFSTFLKGLYQRMGKKWVYCTVESRMPLEDRYLPGATIPSDATEFANDYTAMNQYCDRVEIMAYDQSTVDLRLNAARSAPYAPVADPGWVEDIVRLAAESISRNKLVIGIPTYGYEYTVTPQAGGGQKYQRLWAFNPPYATQIAAQLGITPHRTSANELGFIYNPATLAAIAPSDGDVAQVQESSGATTTVTENLGSQVDTSQPYNYVTWSDATAMKDKIDLAHRLGVRGVAFFSLGGAEDQGLWSVLK